MSRCLVLRLSGPMQAWGVQSRFTERDTDRYPSKSGVIGLLCAALGRDREESLEDLAALEMGVRIDRPGVFSRDFHTAGGGELFGRPYGVRTASNKPGGTVVSERFYLADAEFHVALEGDEEVLKACDTALQQPHWPLCLGRKSFPPTPPVTLGLHDGRIQDVLSALPWRRRSRDRDSDVPSQLRLVLEGAPGEGQARMDLPLSFAHHQRRHALRHLRNEWCKDFVIIDSMEEVYACISHA